MKGRITVQLEVDVPMTLSDESADGSSSLREYGKELKATLIDRHACVDGAQVVSVECA